MSDVKQVLKEIEIRAVEREVKNGNDKGKKFLSYQVLDKNGYWVEARFTKKANNVPKEAGNCIIVVDVTDMNYLGKDRRKYPLVWINNVKEIKQKFNPTPVDDTELPF